MDKKYFSVLVVLFLIMSACNGDGYKLYSEKYIIGSVIEFANKEQLGKIRVSNNNGDSKIVLFKSEELFRNKDASERNSTKDLKVGFLLAHRNGVPFAKSIKPLESLKQNLIISDKELVGAYNSINLNQHQLLQDQSQLDQHDHSHQIWHIKAVETGETLIGVGGVVYKEIKLDSNGIIIDQFYIDSVQLSELPFDAFDAIKLEANDCQTISGRRVCDLKEHRHMIIHY